MFIKKYDKENNKSLYTQDGVEGRNDMNKLFIMSM